MINHFGLKEVTNIDKRMGFKVDIALSYGNNSYMTDCRDFGRHIAIYQSTNGVYAAALLKLTVIRLREDGNNVYICAMVPEMGGYSFASSILSWDFP